MYIKQSNAYGIFIVLVLLAIIFIGMYAALKPFGIIYDHFEDDAAITGSEALSTMQFTRKAWLVIPILFAVGLIIWLISVSTKRDPQQFYLR